MTPLRRTLLLRRTLVFSPNLNLLVAISSGTTTTILRPFVQDYLGRPVPEGHTILDFTEAETMGWQWHQLDHNYASHLHLAPDR